MVDIERPIHHEVPKPRLPQQSYLNELDLFRLGITTGHVTKKQPTQVKIEDILNKKQKINS